MTILLDELRGKRTYYKECIVERLLDVYFHKYPEKLQMHHYELDDWEIIGDEIIIDYYMWDCPNSCCERLWSGCNIPIEWSYKTIEELEDD